MKALHIGAACILIAPICRVARCQKLTEQQAINRAAEFCRVVGAPVTGPADASFPASSGRRPGLPDLYWLPRWKVVFAGQSTVEIVDASGVICEYSNEALAHKLTVDRAPAGSAIPAAEAIRKADRVLTATGERDQLSDPVLQEVQLGSATRAAWHDLLIIRQRQYQGVPYWDDHAAVRLHAETGELLSLSLYFSMTPPPYPNIKALLTVSHDQAIERALAHLAYLGATHLQLQTETLQSPPEPVLIQPNTFWEDGNPNHRKALPLRPAWLVTYKVGERNYYRVWVDAQTGNIIGGEDGSALGAPRPFKIPAGDGKGSAARKK